MSRRSLTASLAPTVQSIWKSSSHRLLQHSSRTYSSTIQITTSATPILSSGSPSTSSPREAIKRRKLNDLNDSIAHDGNPSRVWSHYTSLLNFLGYEKLPLKLHQDVLRKCTATAVELRVSAARHLHANHKSSDPHVHEGRFQTIIRNIRATGMKPTLDDYHFILEQFAAVGHHAGAMQVYKELVGLGLEPRTKTFGLCLQAIAHHLTFPVQPVHQAQRIAQARGMLGNLMNDMRSSGIPFTSVNLDLTIRILKETSDREGFESLMKWGYGIDLSNPDCAPLEYLGMGTIGSDLGMGESSVPGLPYPQPFSTAALNTTIDMLGRLGDVSKLVQAFEVLTQPLPQASQHLFSSFDDEDDFGVSVDSNPKFKPPHASPNTTTYNMLLRHLARAGHAIFARHYLLEAISLDRTTDRALRQQIHKKPLDQIPAPHFAINRGTLIPVFGESNRDKNVGLMRWLATKIPRILRKKRADLAFYSEFRDRMRKRQVKTASSQTPLPEPLSSAPEQPKSSRYTMASVLDMNLDAADPPPIQPKKYFDINLHIRVLQRDIEEIEVFSESIENILGRTTQRIKERLGRRVWAGKDIYLLTDGTHRRKVARETWRGIVQFKPRHGYLLQHAAPETTAERVVTQTPPFARRPSFIARRSFSSSSSSPNVTSQNRFPSPINSALPSHR